MKKCIAIFLIFLFLGCGPSAKYLAKKNTAMADNLPMLIIPYIRSLNSAGGVNLEILFQNIGNKTIKYINIVIIPYNAVGDPITSEVSRRVEAILQVTGPIPPNGENRGFWDNVWYNPTIYCIKISAVRVDYMDNTSETIDNPGQLQNMIIATGPSPPVSYGGTCNF